MHTRGVNLNWHTHSFNTKCIDAYEKRDIFKQYIGISSRKRDAIDVIYFENFKDVDHRFALS